MEADRLRETSPHHHQHCVDCTHFRQDELDTGFCQLYNMFVLQAFWCQKCLYRLPEAQEEGGDSQGSR